MKNKSLIIYEGIKTECLWLKELIENNPYMATTNKEIDLFKIQKSNK